jgi:hypothetical protein
MRQEGASVSLNTKESSNLNIRRATVEALQIGSTAGGMSADCSVSV